MWSSDLEEVKQQMVSFENEWAKNYADLVGHYESATGTSSGCAKRKPRISKTTPAISTEPHQKLVIKIKSS